MDQNENQSGGGLNLSPENGYPGALDQLLARLESLDRETARWSGPHVVRLVSQGQAKPATDAIAAWVPDGGLGSPVSEAEWRAAIYNLGRLAQLLEAFPTISCLAVRALTSNVACAIREGVTLTAMSGLRALTERVALATWLSNKISVFSLADRPDFDSLQSMSEPILRAVYGSALSWNALSGVDLRTFKVKDAAYCEAPGSANMQRVQILNTIDLLDKCVPGTRLSYEILCEFLHPNTGDIWSATTEATSFVDGHGTRHLKRHLGVSDKMFVGALDLQVLMPQVFDIVGESIATYPAVLQGIESSALAAGRISKLAAHKALKRQRKHFSPGDLCPCNSGKVVRRCALVH